MRRDFFSFARKPVRSQNQRVSKRRLRIEALENRELLAVVWSNRGSSTNDSDSFNSVYVANATNARAIVDHAFADWNRIVTNATININVTASPISTIGSTTISSIVAGLPKAATILLDDNGGGSNWFFDSTPTSDSEFSVVTSQFFATRPSGLPTSVDFYSTVAHEIGHALGYASGYSSLLINNFLTPNGANQVTFSSTNGAYPITLSLNTQGGLHSNDNTDLMSGSQYLNARNLITDDVAKVLASAYGYSISLPSQNDNIAVNLDPATGAISVNPMNGTFNDNLNFQGSTVSGQPYVTLFWNGSFERYPKSQISSISISGGAGDDGITANYNWDPNIFVPVTFDSGIGNDVVVYFMGPSSNYSVNLANGQINRTYRFGGAAPLYSTMSLPNTEQVLLYGFLGSATDDFFTIGAGLAYTRLAIYGADGNDNINATNSSVPVLAYGQGGDDTITGSNFADILVGGDGADTIYGLNGRDVIFGGAGFDTIIANANAGDEDLIVSGTTNYDQNYTNTQLALISIRDEWNSTRSRTTRIANISGTGSGTRLNTGFLTLTANSLSVQSVFDDGVSDSVFSQINVDWYIN